MNDRPAPPPLINAPFEPRPANGGGAGCGRMALIGCGGALLLLGVAAVVFVLNARSVLRWGLEWSQRQIQTQIERTMPAEVTAEDRERLRAAFAAATARVTSEQADPADLARMQEELQRIMPKLEAGLGREEVARLTAALEDIAAPDPAEPEAAPGDSGGAASDAGPAAGEAEAPGAGAAAAEEDPASSAGGAGP